MLLRFSIEYASPCISCFEIVFPCLMMNCLFGIVNSIMQITVFLILILHFLVWNCISFFGIVNFLMKILVFLNLRSYFLVWDCISYFGIVNSIMQGLVFLMESCAVLEREGETTSSEVQYMGWLSISQCIYNENLNIDEHFWWIFEHWWTFMINISKYLKSNIWAVSPPLNAFIMKIWTLMNIYDEHLDIDGHLW